MKKLNQGEEGLKCLNNLIDSIERYLALNKVFVGTVSDLSWTKAEARSKAYIRRCVLAQDKFFARETSRATSAKNEQTVIPEAADGPSEDPLPICWRN